MLARRLLFTALAILLLVSPALSAAIAVPNYDFSSPYVPNISPYATAGVSDWLQSPIPAGWTTQGWDDTVGAFLNVPSAWIDNLVPSGGTAVHQQAGFMFSAPGLELSQTLSTSYQVGTSYQLTVGIEGGGYGMPLGVPMEIGLYYTSGTNQIMVGTTIILNDNTTLPISHLPDRQLTIPALASSSACIGKNIGIALLQIAGTANTGYWDVGNVRLVATPATTSTAVWTGAALGNTNWSNTGNWGGVAPASGALLTFANSASGNTTSTNDLPTGTSFAGITFAAGSTAYNLTGNSIQLSGPVVNQSILNQTISLDMQTTAGGGTLDTGSGSMTIAGAISGSPLTKVGAGILILSGDNSYTGGTTVLDGTLEITTPDALPTGSSLTIGDTGSWTDISDSAPVQAATYVSVPEPGTFALLAVCMAAAGIIRNRRRSPSEAVLGMLG